MSLGTLLEEVHSKYSAIGLEDEWRVEGPTVKLLLETIGEKLKGHYALTRALGVGSTSIVLEVRDERLGNLPRALKLARPKVGKAGSILAIFDQEVRVLLSINHENIVKLYYKDEVKLGESTHPYFVLEFIESPTTWDEWLVGADASANAFLGILRQLVRALAYLERLGIVHCDVKPANVIVGAGGMARLTDLGYAKFVRPQDRNLTGITFTEEFAHPKLIAAAHDRTDPLANVAKFMRSDIITAFDRYALGKSVLKLIRVGVGPLGEMNDYDSRYLRIVAARLLDCEHVKAGLDFLEEKTLEEICYETTAEAEEDVARLTNEFVLEDRIKELSPYVRETLQLPATGRMPFTKRVEKVMRHPAFERLARVSQLGFLNMIYPGASHSRFEHCLGTFGNAGLYIRALYYDPMNPLFRSIMRERDILAAMLAALLHDIGQYPLAHDLEEADHKSFSHTQWTEKLLGEPFADGSGNASTLADVIKEWWHIDAREVLEVVKPESHGNRFRARILHSIIDGPIDADKFDYVQRDSHHLGLPYGTTVDKDRFLSCLTVAYTNQSLV